VTTTLDIENDVLAAAEKLARDEGTTTGRVLSELARAGLEKRSTEPKIVWKNGVPTFPATGQTITMEKIQRIIDDEGV
jgi:hypothetical protein